MPPAIPGPDARPNSLNLERNDNEHHQRPSLRPVQDRDIEINRLGYGAMRITGPGIWGAPSDRNAALATLCRLPELGVNFIDTADSYGPDVSEQLIREALHPYDGLLIATKAGLTRSGPTLWTSNCRPDYLIDRAKGSLKKLGVEQIDLWQLHRIDPSVPRDEQFGAVKQLLDEGVIRHAGLSRGLGRRHQAASASLSRGHGPEQLQPGRPRQRRCGGLLQGQWHRLHSLVPAGGGRIDPARRAGRASPRPIRQRPGQVALAWLLKRSPVMLPIPGTLRVAHRQFDANVFGLFAMTRAVLPIMRQQRGGHVISITSVAGIIGFPGSGYYAASKHAVEGWADALAVEGKSVGIKVTCVEPGHFRTDWAGRSMSQTPNRVAAEYAETAGARIVGAKEISGKQPGDPARAADAIIKVAGTDNAPRHLVLGAVAFDSVIARLNADLAEVTALQDVAIAADFPPGE